MSENLSELQPYDYLKAFNETQQRLLKNSKEPSNSLKPKLIPLTKFPLHQNYKKIQNVFKSVSSNQKNSEEQKSQSELFDQMFFQKHRSFMQSVLSGIIKDSEEQIIHLKNKIYSQTISSRSSLPQPLLLLKNHTRTERKSQTFKTFKTKKSQNHSLKKLNQSPHEQIYRKLQTVEERENIIKDNIIKRQRKFSENIFNEEHLVYEPQNELVLKEKKKIQKDRQINFQLLPKINDFNPQSSIKKSNQILKKGLLKEDGRSSKHSKSVSGLSNPKSKILDKHKEDLINKSHEKEKKNHNLNQTQELKNIQKYIQQRLKGITREKLYEFEERPQLLLNQANKALLDLEQKQKIKQKTFALAIQENINTFKEIANEKIQRIKNSQRY